MTITTDTIATLIAAELDRIWAAHKAVGLSGHMRLFTPPEQVPFRNKQPGIVHWFTAEETQSAAALVVEHYNRGHLPNSSLLLDPIVHEKTADGSYSPLGSGIAWAMSLCLGIDSLKDESVERIAELGVGASPFQRGGNDRAGLKIVAVCDEAQAPVDNQSVTACRELYELAAIESPQYAGYYLLSGLNYLTNNGLFYHPDSAPLFRAPHPVAAQNILDAAYCWNAYERHHSLYRKFGTDPADVQSNMKFFNLVARDVQLFDSTGPMRKEADEMFEFIVPGLIPRGSVTMLAAAGGTGKSSIAHQLCVLAATDYEPGEEAPRWLGQRLAIEKCKGICVYFSGEDGPPIINARAALFDPQGRAKRLMFQRTNFGEGVTFYEHLNRLRKIPDVPIMVIDPARKYLTGDEEDSNAASEFFEALEEFAIAKGTAVVIVHHLQKGADPKSPRDVLDALRGSQVFVDRPRVVIGMVRDGAYTVAGLAKNNIPPNLGMVSEERVFARDPKHLSLIWLPGHEGVRNAELSQEELDKIAEAAHAQGR